MPFWLFPTRPPIAIAIALVMAATTAHAQLDPSAELGKGIAAINKGSANTAINHLTLVIKANNRSTKDLARALLYRAKAYHAMQRPAQALADIQSALWLNQLSRSEHRELSQLKQSAMKAAGMRPFAKVEKAALPPVAGRTTSRNARENRRTGSTTTPKKTLSPWDYSSRNGTGPLQAPVRQTRPKSVATPGAPSTEGPTPNPRTKKPVRTASPAVRPPAHVVPARVAPARRARVQRTRPRPAAASTPAMTNWTTAVAARKPAPVAARPAQPQPAIRPFATTTRRAPLPTTTASVRPPPALTKPAPVTAPTTRQPTATPTPSQLPRTAVITPPRAPQATPERPAEPAAAPPATLPIPALPAMESFMVLTGMKKRSSSLDEWRAEADRRMRERQQKIRQHNANVPPPEPGE